MDLKLDSSTLIGQNRNLPVFKPILPDFQTKFSEKIDKIQPILKEKLTPKGVFASKGVTFILLINV